MTGLAEGTNHEGTFALHGPKCTQAMDALFFFRHGRFQDLEIRYALRGIARHAPWVRKVWVFGVGRSFSAGTAR